VYQAVKGGGASRERQPKSRTPVIRDRKIARQKARTAARQNKALTSADLLCLARKMNRKMKWKNAKDKKTLDRTNQTKSIRNPPNLMAPKMRSAAPTRSAVPSNQGDHASPPSSKLRVANSRIGRSLGLLDGEGGFDARSKLSSIHQILPRFELAQSNSGNGGSVIGECGRWSASPFRNRALEVLFFLRPRGRCRAEWLSRAIGLRHRGRRFRPCGGPRGGNTSA
jgi:hypothetical protein